jgi:hypothetical protein
MMREFEGRNLKVFTDLPFSWLSIKLTATGDITLHEVISRVETVVAGMPGSFQHLGSVPYHSQGDVKFSSEHLPLVLWFYYTK